MRGILGLFFVLSLSGHADGIPGLDEGGECPPGALYCKPKVLQGPKPQAPQPPSGVAGSTPPLVRWPCPSCPGGFRWGDPATGQTYHQINGQFVAKGVDFASQPGMQHIARTQGYSYGQGNGADAATGPSGAVGPAGQAGPSGSVQPPKLSPSFVAPSQFSPLPEVETAKATVTLLGAGLPGYGWGQMGSSVASGLSGHAQGTKDPWANVVAEARNRNDIAWAEGAPVLTPLNRQVASIPSNVGFYAEVSDGKGGTKQDTSVLLTRGFGERKNDFVVYLQSDNGSYVAVRRGEKGYEPAYGALNGQVGKPTEASMAGLTNFLTAHGQVPKPGERFIGQSTITNEADARLLFARGDAKAFAASFTPGAEGRVVVKGGIAVGKTESDGLTRVLVPPPAGEKEPVVLTVNNLGELVAPKDGTLKPEFVAVMYQADDGKEGTFKADGVKQEVVDSFTKFGPPRELIPVMPKMVAEPTTDKKEPTKD